MKKFYLSFFLIVLAGVLFSCSTADDLEEENPPYPDITTDSEKYPAYQDAVKDICSQIESNLIHDNESLVEAAKSFSNFSGSRIVNGIQYVTFDGNWDFFVDFDGKCIAREGDISTWDDSEFEDLLDPYDELLDDCSSARSSTMSDTRSLDSEQLSKATFKVLHWCPLKEDTKVDKVVKALCTRISYKGERVVDYTSIRGSMTSAADLSTFNNYDVVFFETHGSAEGYPMVPSDFKGLEKSKNIEWGLSSDGTLYYVLDYNFLTRYLPEMKNTVLWTLMCYSYTEDSILGSAALARHAGDYFGATDAITAPINLKYFKDFLLNLLRGATSSGAFGPKQGVTYQFTDDLGTVKGVFGHNTSSFKGVCHPFLSVDEPQSGRPVGYWIAPPDEMEKVVEGNGKFKAGIRLIKINNSDTIQIPLLKENLITSTTETKNNVAESLQAVFKTDSIAKGNYKYESYVTFEDGSTVYSDYSQFLTVGQTGGNKFTISVNYSGENDDYEIFSTYDNSLFFEGWSGVDPNFEVTNVVCQEYPSLSSFWDWSGNAGRGSLYFDLADLGLDEGLLHFDIYYKGELKYMDLGNSVVGGILPSSVEVLEHLEDTDVKVLSANENETGDYTLTVPKTLIYIVGTWNYFSAPPLERIDLSGCANLLEIGGDPFRGCKFLKSVNLDGCTSLTKIGEYAFCGCTSLTNIGLENLTNLQEIGRSAFGSCTSLTNIRLENLTNLQEIGWCAFSGCESLKTVNIDGCTSLTSIPYHTFTYCTSLSSFNLVGCTSLTEVVVLLSDCTSLTNIGLKNLTNLQVIEEGTFSGCESLKTVNIDGCTSLTEINGAFGGCTSLTNIGLENLTNLQVIGRSAFCGCTSLTNIGLENLTNLQVIGVGTFMGCESLKTVNLDGCTSLTKIEEDAFRGCTSLTNIGLENLTNLQVIEEYAFRDCTSLTNIGLENLTNLQEIGWEAFSGCESLKTVNLDGCTSLTKIGEYAFCGCTSLTNIGLENLTNLQEIGRSAFYNTKLKSVTIPSSVKYIREDAFKGIPKIGYVKCLPSSVPILYEDSHHYHYRLPFERDQVIYVPANAKEEYEEYWGVWEEETDADGNTNRKYINIRTF